MFSTGSSLWIATSQGGSPQDVQIGDKLPTNAETGCLNTEHRDLRNLLQIISSISK